MNCMKRAFLVFLVIIGAAAIASAKVNVSIHEWNLPTPKSRPHDPTVGADGALWYTAQQANAIGRLDPATGEIKQFALKTPDSGPHGLVSDSGGNIWFTANYAGYIGKLDPKSGNVTEYKINDPRGHDPHTPVIAPDGRVRFTVQQGNVVGVLEPNTLGGFDPKDARFQKRRIPGGGGVVRNMVATKDGRLYLACSGVNQVAVAKITNS